MSTPGETTKSRAKKKAKIFKSLKDYVYSDVEMFKYLRGSSPKSLKIVKNEKFKSLYYDTVDNTSLALYMSMLTTGSFKGVSKNTLDSIMSNPLIKNFTYSLGQGNKPSHIDFKSIKGSTISEKEYYEAFHNLLSENFVLPALNGKSYTSQQLAQDLVTYSLLGGANFKQQHLLLNIYLILI